MVRMSNRVLIKLQPGWLILDECVHIMHSRSYLFQTTDIILFFMISCKLSSTKLILSYYFCIPNGSFSLMYPASASLAGV